VRHELLPEGLRISWIVESCPDIPREESTISYVPLRRKSGGLSDSSLLWLFQRHVDELPEYSVVIVVDVLLAKLKLNSSSFKGIILPQGSEFHKEALSLYQTCSAAIVVC